MTPRRTTLEVCGERLDLALFGSREHAVEHLRRHVLDASERWDTLIPAETIEAARAPLRRPAAEASLAVNALYDRYASRVEEGMAFGASLPLHVHYTRRPATSSAAQDCFGFVSHEGVRIFADRRRVRTAYRAALRPEGHSDYAYFARAWFDVAMRAPGPRTVEAPEGPIEEDVRRTCLWDPTRAPPNVVEWKAMVKSSAREERPA